VNKQVSQTIATFYKFADLPEYQDWKRKLIKAGFENDILGTIILAPEGINATIAGSKKNIDTFINLICEDDRFTDITPRTTESPRSTFYRLRIITRPEIVTLGDPSINPNKKVGQYVEPEDWDSLIQDPDVRVIDTRNEYEVAIGTFRGAENPHTQIFSEWPEFVEKNLKPKKKQKIAMFCTGGIRCEKASSQLLENGFDEVYHLKGGILNYLEKIPAEKSQWNGECFIFDHRVSVTHGLKDGHIQLCFGCRWPVTKEDLDSPKYEPGVSCPHCHDTLDDKKRLSLQERNRQIKLAKERNLSHLGLQMPN
jgi:UPF0176 protein